MRQAPSLTSDTAFMAIFPQASSLQEVNAREFALYPKPAKRFVNLEFEALKENALLQIPELDGRKAGTFELKAARETLRINVGELSEVVRSVMPGNAAKKPTAGQKGNILSTTTKRKGSESFVFSYILLSLPLSLAVGLCLPLHL